MEETYFVCHEIIWKNHGGNHHTKLFLEGEEKVLKVNFISCSSHRGAEVFLRLEGVCAWENVNGF